jgi:hypothetical protein
MMLMPGLVALYPCGPVGVAGQLQDLQSNGNHLTLHGNPTFEYDGLIPYVAYDGTGDYHDITDAASSNAFDILGTAAAEPWIGTNGLSCWGWFYPEETSTAEQLLGKWTVAGSRSYRLLIDASDQFQFQVSDDGTNSDTATSAAVTVPGWYFVMGRFDPGATVEIIVNGTEVTQATARAAAFNSAADFAIGASGTGGAPYEGRVSLGGVSAAYLSDDLYNLMYQQTRALYGV